MWTTIKVHLLRVVYPEHSESLCTWDALEINIEPPVLVVDYIRTHDPKVCWIKFAEEKATQDYPDWTIMAISIHIAMDSIHTYGCLASIDPTCLNPLINDY